MKLILSPYRKTVIYSFFFSNLFSKKLYQVKSFIGINFNKQVGETEEILNYQIEPNERIIEKEGKKN